MPKYQVWLPSQTRIIDADDEDQAQEIFMERDDIFDFLEVEEAEETGAGAKMSSTPGGEGKAKQ